MFKLNCILLVATCIVSVHAFDYDLSDDFDLQPSNRYSIGKFKPRIVEGYVPFHHQYPFMAYVYLGSSKNCTGTIIASQYVLTAWHCLRDGMRKAKINSEKEAVRYLNVKVGSMKKQFARAYSVMAHYRLALSQNRPDPKFNFNPNDMLILMLTTAIRFDLNNAPVRLAIWKPILREKVIVLGHGDRVVKGLMREEESYVIGNATIARDDWPYKNCFTTEDVNEGITEGDSGGPALINVNGEYIQVGMAIGSRVQNITGTRKVRSEGYFLKMGPFCNKIQKYTKGAATCLFEHEL